MSSMFRVTSCTCKNNTSSLCSPHELIQCPLCQTYQHSSCVPPSILSSPKYICPKCLFLYLDPFLKQEASFLPPTRLTNPESTFTFKPTITKDSFILIRCVTFKGKYELKWAPVCNISLNNKIIFALKYPNKGYNEPIAIVNNELMRNTICFKRNTLFSQGIINIVNSAVNSITVSIDPFAFYHNAVYYISIDLVSPIQSLSTLKKSVRGEFKKEILCKYTGCQYDTSVQPLYDYVDMVDIYSGVDQIKIPVRGYFCNHTSFFDLEKFLVMNQRTIKKVCPFCHQLLGRLYIDMAVAKVIKENKGEISKLKISSNYDVIEPIYEKKEYGMVEDDDMDMEEEDTCKESIYNNPETIYIDSDDDEPVKKEEDNITIYIDGD